MEIPPGLKTGRFEYARVSSTSEEQMYAGTHYESGKIWMIFEPRCLMSQRTICLSSENKEREFGSSLYSALTEKLEGGIKSIRISLQFYSKMFYHIWTGTRP